jgi:hypothetical protein
VIVETDGGPLGVVSAADVPDAKLLKQTIAAIAVDPPQPHLTGAG